MKYVNKVTGASIDIPCVLNSELWELVPEKVSAPISIEPKAEEKPAKKKIIKK